MDFTPIKEVCQGFTFNKLKLHMGLLKVGGGYKGV
jgi:hypothetical protein